MNTLCSALLSQVWRTQHMGWHTMHNSQSHGVVPDAPAHSCSPEHSGLQPRQCLRALKCCVRIRLQQHGHDKAPRCINCRWNMRHGMCFGVVVQCAGGILSHTVMASTSESSLILRGSSRPWLSTTAGSARSGDLRGCSRAVRARYSLTAARRAIQPAAVDHQGRPLLREIKEGYEMLAITV